MILHYDYFLICERNNCAAKVLSQMEYWHNIKLNHLEQAEAENASRIAQGGTADQSLELWVYKSSAAMQDELIGDHGEKAVEAAFLYLCSRGFLLTRANPKDRRDRTRQYFFSVSKVQAAIDALVIKPQKCGMQTAEMRNAKRENAECKPQNPPLQGAELRDSIRLSSETTSETTDNNDRRPDSNLNGLKSAEPWERPSDEQSPILWEAAIMEARRRKYDDADIQAIMKTKNGTKSNPTTWLLAALDRRKAEQKPSVAEETEAAIKRVRERMR